MTATPMVQLRCDHAGWDMTRCPQWKILPAPVHGARATAALVGWARRIGTGRHVYDLCPAHAADVPGRTFPDWRNPR